MIMIDRMYFTVVLYVHYEVLFYVFIFSSLSFMFLILCN